MFTLRAPLFLLPLFVHLLTAGSQHNAPLNGPAITSSAGLPTPSDIAPPFATTTTAPAPTTGTRSVLNYYFLLLAVFVVVVIVLWFVLARRRKRRYAQAATRRQGALAADLERWPGDGRGRSGGGGTARTGRWHVLRVQQPKPLEGLNERGEAPPAYVAKPEAVVLRPEEGGGGEEGEEGEAFELHGKPPDYEDGRHAGGGGGGSR